jgi:hypothetical protein
VSAGAVRNVEFPIDEAPPAAPVDEQPAGDTPSVDVASSGEGSDTPSGTGNIAAPTNVGGQTVDLRTSFEGIPLWLVIVLMIAAFLLSRPLSALADRALSRGGGAVACPLEKT